MNKLSIQGQEYIPSYAKNKSESKIKPITLIGNKTEIGKELEKYNFMRSNNFSLNNISEKNKNIQFDPKKALILDILNDKEQKNKLFLWKYFCIWRGNAINKYNELGDILKFIRGASLNNLRGDFIETLKSVKNPRLYSIALKKFLMNLFHKNIDLLRDAFNRWKKVVNKENMNLLKSKFFYSLCKKNDKKNKEEENGISEAINTTDNLRKNKKFNLKGEYPDEVKNILSLYFNRWRGGPGVRSKFFFGKKTVSLPENLIKLVFKKDKISENFIESLLDNIPEEKKEDEIKQWIHNPLRRMFLLRYRKERMHIYKYLLKWYNKVRLILAINHLERIVEGRQKLTKLLRFKPSKILYKKMKLMNPKFYKSKGEKLITALLNITKKKPFKKLLDNIKLINRINILRNIQPKAHDRIKNYLLKKYFDIWKQNVDNLKEQKIKLLLTYVKKKIKDEDIISQHRKKELLKRFILNKEKNKINNLLLAFKVWHKLTLLQKAQKPLIREKEGELITMINGEEKIIDGKNIRDGGKINIELKKDEDGKFTIEEIINNNLTEEERQNIIKKKIPNTINLIDDKIKSLIQTKFYKWKNITHKIICDKNARIIQRFIRKKLAKLLWKKKVKFFADLSQKYTYKKISNFAKVNNIDKIIKKIIIKKLVIKYAKIIKNRNNFISLYLNILKAKKNLDTQNKHLALNKILKLYIYIIIKNLFSYLINLQRNKAQSAFKDFISKLKEISQKKAEYTYEKKISNENMPLKKKLSFSKRKSSNKINRKDIINKSIPYISLVPHLFKFLDDKFIERKKLVFNKIIEQNKSLKLNSSLTKYINNKIISDKTNFYNLFKRLATNGEKQKKLFELLRKYFIKKLLFINIDEPVRLLNLTKLIKISIVNQEIAQKRWIRVLIRKWRFLSFSRNISKKKMAILYKNFHLNYLEMVNDVFGEEKLDNPSVIKEFERFGANVGMWENEHPDFVEESNFCKNVQKKFSFHMPTKIEKIEKKDIKEIKDEIKEENNIEEIKEIKDYLKEEEKKDA